MHQMELSEGYNDWKDDLMRYYFKAFKLLVIYPLLLGLLVKVFISLCSSISIYDCNREFYAHIITVVLLFVVCYIDYNHSHLRVYSLLILLEFLSINSFLSFYDGSSGTKIYSIGLSYVSFFLEFFLVGLNSWVLLVFQLKTAYLWFTLDMLISHEIDIRSLIGPVVGLICLNLTLMAWAYIRESVLFAVFSYRNKIRKNQRNLEIIVNSMPDGLIVLSMDMKVKLCNESLRNILKLDTEHNFLSTFEKLSYSENRRTYTVGTESSIYADVKCHIASSSKIPVSFGVTRIDDKFYEWRGNFAENNKKMSFILLARDCTALINLEKSQSIQICQTAMLRSFSHEIRTPVSAIIATNEQLEKECRNASVTVIEKFQIIDINSNLLLNLINNLLDSIKLSAGTFALNRTSFNLCKAVNSVLNLFLIQSNKKKIYLSYNIDPKLPSEIFTDFPRFRQILINLVSNALKYTQNGSIVLRFSHKHDNLQVHVKDTGIGIQSYRLEKLFDLFESLDQNGRVAHGFGLKLHISNLIAQKLGGERIAVKSRQNYGTTFKFLVSIEREELNRSFYETENLEESVFANVLPQTKTKKNFMKTIPNILIVDDNEFNRIIVGEFLKQELIDYDEAINGLSACKHVEKRNKLDHGYSVILMDIQMPVMDGWEATRKIIEMHTRGDIKNCPVVIGYSAYSGKEEEIRAQQAGMTDLLLKPTPKNELIRVLKKYL